MSRYNIGNDVVVGWDPPLETFFIHKYDPNDEDNLLVDEGGWPKEIPSLFGSTEKAGLLTIANEYGIVIPDNICHQLESDQANSEAPTQHQRDMIAMVSEMMEGNHGED